MIYFDTCQTPIGVFYITASQDNVLSFLPFLPEKIKDQCLRKQTKIIQEVKNQINAYFKKDLTSFNLPLLIEGSDFEKKVFRQILQIDYGKQKSYKEIAKAISNPLSYRAVGNACNKNHFCIIIPCHRVVSCKNLGGYAFGLEKKIFLLNFESS